MWWMSLVAAARLTMDDAVDETVGVWARPFARFDDKRWLVRSDSAARES